jgi:hypothetical protein
MYVSKTLILSALAVISLAPPPSAQAAAVPPPTILHNYADLADLADSAPLVARVEIKKQALIEPQRAAGLRPGWARLYIEAKTEALLTGNAALGEALRYLVDVPLDARGKVPSLKKKRVLLFARTVAGRPGDLQLVAPDAQLLWDAPLEARLRGVLSELLAAGAPGRISGVREVIYVPGTLAGEGETQMFLSTPDDAPASITVAHHPGKAASWGVTFSEVLDGAALPPARDTLAWYRLACFLPPALPPKSNVSETSADRSQAVDDYRLVRGQLGTCARTRN